jgi:hypothetical protein
MGDHVNGPSKVYIDSNDSNLVSIIDDLEFIKQNDGQTISIKELFKLNANKFLGKAYIDRFTA